MEDPIRSVVAIENIEAAISQIAQTTLRAVVGCHTLDEQLSETEGINQNIREILDVQTANRSTEGELVSYETNSPIEQSLSGDGSSRCLSDCRLDQPATVSVVSLGESMRQRRRFRTMPFPESVPPSVPEPARASATIRGQPAGCSRPSRSST